MMRNPVMFVVEVGSVAHDAPARPRLIDGTARRRIRLCRSPSGSGSRCSSPTSPKRWPRGAARRRPTSLRRAQDRDDGEPRPARRAGRGRGRARAAQRATSSSSRRASSSPATARSSRASRPWTSRPSRASRAPVIREAGGDRSAVTGGTRVLSDQIKVRITSNPGETFLDRMIALVEGAERQKTPNEIALEHPARGTHDHLPAGGRHAPAVRHLLERAAIGLRARQPARLPDPDDHRRTALAPSASPGWTG